MKNSATNNHKSIQRTNSSRTNASERSVVKISGVRVDVVVVVGVVVGRGGLEERLNRFYWNHSSPKVKML